MATLTIEITDDMKKYVDRQIAKGGFKDGSAVVHALFNVALVAEKRAEIDQKLLEAIDEIERGECAPWQPGDASKLLQEIVRERGHNGKR
jgi:Arc/MetJ-type ribon-helix-helix transcriptional regulator